MYDFETVQFSIPSEKSVEIETRLQMAKDLQVCAAAIGMEPSPMELRNVGRTISAAVEATSCIALYIICCLFLAGEQESTAPVLDLAERLDSNGLVISVSKK